MVPGHLVQGVYREACLYAAIEASTIAANSSKQILIV